MAISRSPYTVAQSFVYFVDVLLTRFLWCASVPNGLPLARSQGCIIVANHRSSVDPFFIQLSTRRVVHWLVAAEYFKKPGMGAFLRFCQAIPTNRSGRDTTATKLAIRLAQRGGVVGMFPEGKINRSTELMMRVRPGAVLIASKAGVPIVPCYIKGSPFGGSILSPFFTMARVIVQFGNPIYLEHYPGIETDREQQRKAMEDCVREIARLAHVEDFQPESASKDWLKATN